MKKFPFKGTIVEGARLNQQLVPVFLATVVQVADWWAAQNVAAAEKLRLARHLREAYVTVEEISDQMQEPGFWEDYDLYIVTNTLKDLLDRLAPIGFYFGAKEGTMDNYGFWDDESLVGPYPVYE